MRSSPSCCSSSLPTSNSPHDPPTVRLETSYHRTIRGTPSAPGAAVENCGGTRASVDTVAPHAEVESHKISHAFSINALLFAHTTPFFLRGGGRPPVASSPAGPADIRVFSRFGRAAKSPQSTEASDLSRVVESETPRDEREASRSETESACARPQPESQSAWPVRNDDTALCIVR